MSCIRNLENEPEDWLAGGYPLVTMMNIEVRKGKKKPVIKKALVELEGPLFKLYESKREEWALGDFFNMVASVQYDFPGIKPYLGVPPKSEEFDAKPDKEYNPEEKPFAIIHNYNLNELSDAIAK